MWGRGHLALFRCEESDTTRDASQIPPNERSFDAHDRSSRNGILSGWFKTRLNFCPLAEPGADEDEMLPTGKKDNRKKKAIDKNDML
jgi:hypothetical protein